MKKILLFLAILSFSVVANAQYPVWSDDFTEGNADGWSLWDLDADGFNWAMGGVLQDDGSFSSSAQVLASYCMDFSDFSWLPNNQNNWAISPEISLGIEDSYYYGGDIKLVINWQCAVSKWSLIDLDVYCSTAPDYTDSTSLVNSFTLLETFNSRSTFADYELDITDFVGENTTFYIAIVNNSFFSYGMEVQTVSVSASEIVEIITNVDVESVSLSQSDTALSVGDTDTLTATVLPSNATNKNVSWASSNTSIASVDTVGVVKAIAAGSANIIVTTQDGGFSDTCAITVKASQTISNFDNIGKTYGDDDFDLSATATSGEAVTYNIADADVATVSGNTVTITGAGTTTITALQAGNDNYGAVDSSIALTVAKASQTISNFENISKTYGDDDFDLAATASSGLDVTYTVADITIASVNGSTVHIKKAGETTITASQAGNDNYNATDSTVTLTIAKASQTISGLQDIVKTMGDADFDLSATASSGEVVSYSVVDASVATVNGNTVHLVGEGTTDIIVLQAGTDNYEAVQDTATLTVNPKDKQNQSISNFEEISKTYGDADFYLTAIASSDLEVTYSVADTTIASVNGSTVHLKKAGETTITASQIGDDNYNATDSTVTLTIAKASQIISGLQDIVKTMGDADFDLSATASSGEVVSYSVVDASVATVNGNTVHLVGEGTTDIIVLQAGTDNYEAVQDTATLTVNSKEKQNQSISNFEEISKTYGDDDFDLTATASSGLGVTYSVADTAVASVNGSTVHIKKAGETTVTASQIGDGNHNATDSTVTLTIAKAPQTINGLQDIAKTVGDADFDLSATASSDLGVTYSVADTAVASVDGSTVHIKKAGETTVTASQIGDDNYNATDSTVTLTIAKAPQTISGLQDIAKTVDDADFDLSATASSGLDVTYTVADTAVASVNGSTVHIKKAGETTITASQAGNDNYGAAKDTTVNFTVNSTSAIDDIKHTGAGLNVFPNPLGEGNLHVTFNATGRHAVLRIVSMVGKEVYRKKLGTNITETVIETDNLNSGVYMLVYTDGNVKCTQKFVKQ